MLTIYRFISAMLLPRPIGIRTLKQLLKNTRILQVIAVIVFSAPILPPMPANAKDFSDKKLDAIDGTPVLDIKPVMEEFLPQRPILQPKWSHELMTNYWKIKQTI